MDYRAAPQDVTQDDEDADELIDRPVLTMWGEDFSAVGQAYDVLDVWKGMARDVRGVPIPQCGPSARRSAPTSSTGNSSTSLRTGTADRTRPPRSTRRRRTRARPMSGDAAAVRRSSAGWGRDDVTAPTGPDSCAVGWEASPGTLQRGQVPVAWGASDELVHRHRSPGQTVALARVDLGMFRVRVRAAAWAQAPGRTHGHEQVTGGAPTGKATWHAVRNVPCMLAVPRPREHLHPARERLGRGGRVGLPSVASPD